MSDRTQLEQAITHLESQRSLLGDAATDAVIVAIRKQLAGLTTESKLESGERRLVTVMFADISGFTALSEKMDPEAVRDLMNRCFDRLVPCIKHFDGTIDKFIGDEIMALFGAPVAHENDPERALRAALEMQSALAAFNREVSGTSQVPPTLELGIHFGINTGLVLAGGIGSSGQQEYSVMGDAVNLAARLEDVSERGQILAGADTYRLTAPLFEFETLTPVSVKGKSEPVAVYRLIGAKAGASSTRGLERKGLSSPLVGREKEFQILEKLIEALSQGHQGAVAGIIGEAGLGKSRLMAELHHNAQGIQWLEGKTLSFGQSISYFPFKEIVRTYMGISEDDTELVAWKKLEAKIVSLFPETALDILPYLATLLAIEVQNEYIERVKYLDGDALGKRVFLAMRRFVEKLARTQPLVLVFEDMHWMDASSAELLEHVLTLVREVPLLVIGLSRPDPGTAGAHLREICAEKYADCYIEIRLAPLSQSESAQLVNNLLAIDELPARVRETMTQKAEGNPFYIEEIIRSLLDMGAIVRDPATGRWRATAQIESVHIPDTVQGVIIARIDRLDEEMKQALRMAAVIGRSFLYRILREIDAADGALDTHLAQLQQVELIREKQATPELEYIFKHALAQEATYESILLQKRRELHGHVAQAIETIFAERLDEFYSLLAYHFAKAENWEKAQEYLFKSGDQAGHMAADAEALAHYRQAMDAYTKAFGDHWDPLQRALLYKKIGDALYRRGEHQQAVEYFYGALAYLGHPLPSTIWGVRGVILREFLKQIANALFPSFHPTNDPKEATPVLDSEFAIYALLGMMYAFSNSGKMMMNGLLALNRAEEENVIDATIIGLAGIGGAGAILGIPRLAESYLERALALTAKATGARPSALVYYIFGFYLFGRGRLEKANDCMLEATRIYRAMGDLVELAAAEAHIANYLFYWGNCSSALAMCEKNVAIARETQNINVECYFLLGVAKNNSILGNWEFVVEQMKRSIELGMKIPNYLHYVESLGYLGWHHMKAGHLDDAAICLEEALAGIEKYHTYGFYNMQTYNTYAEVCLLKAAQNDSEKNKCLKKSKTLLDRGFKQSQTARVSLPETQRLRGRYDWLKGNSSAARKWWERSLQEAETMGLRYFAALTHLEMGQCLRDMEHLQKAEAIFAELGATLDLQKTRDFLKE